MTASAMDPLRGWEVHVGKKQQKWVLEAHSLFNYKINSMRWLIHLWKWQGRAACDMPNDNYNEDGRLTALGTTTRMGGLQRQRRGFIAAARNTNKEGLLYHGIHKITYRKKIFVSRIHQRRPWRRGQLACSIHNGDDYEVSRLMALETDTEITPHLGGREYNAIGDKD